MNRLSTEKRALILHLLVEGSSMRAASRVAGVSYNSTAKLLYDAGKACRAFHDANVRGLRARYIQCDEIWAFCYSKRKQAPLVKGNPEYAGDAWTWTAMDSESKMMLSWLVSPTREAEYATVLMTDLQPRLANRVQLSTDGLGSYLVGIEAFRGEVDFARVVKILSPDGQHIIGTEKETVVGNPDLARISTSHMERQNLTTRMSVRRFTRLTNAFSKRLENHDLALALFFTYYNWCRPHMGLGGRTPAMAAGLAPRPFNLEGLVNLVNRSAPPLAPRGPYRRRKYRRGFYLMGLA